jgi:hypothetical protein
VSDELGRWAARLAPDVLARAEAEAVAVLRDALVEAALARRRTPAAAPAPESPPSNDLVWAYCVARAGEPGEFGHLVGVASSGAVERIEAAGLAALVSRVPAAEFTADALQRNLNDIDWVERVARAHESVLEHALATATIVPLRLCTIYETGDGVRAMLERDRDTFVEVLSSLSGRQEWGIKLLVDRDELEEAARAHNAEVAALAREVDTHGGGGQYMLRRRLEREVRHVADSLATEVSERIHARVQDWAVDAVTQPPQNRELSRHEGEMLLNGAYLVESDRVDGLRALANELEERHQAIGARVELTGPWPPYNFVPREGDPAIA